MKSQLKEWQTIGLPNTLTATDRLKAVILIDFLNKYGDIDTAIAEIRLQVLPLIYPKGIKGFSKKERHRNNIGRYSFIRTIKSIYKDYITSI